MVYSSEYESAEYIHVNSCDCQHLFGKDIGSLRENGRRDYHLLFITEGCCFLTENGTVTPVEAGSVIIYFPHERQQYHFSGGIKSTSYYVHFSGIGCRDMLRNLDLTQRYFYVGESSLAESLFKRMIEEYFARKTYSEQLCNGYLCTLLAIFASKRLSSPLDSHGRTIYRIEKACKDMIRNYDKPLDINKYATECNLSSSRFSHLFKECTGQSPQSYFIGVKIKKACELLENTDLSVSEIGEQVGIPDQNYFSRLFKKYTSKSPTSYKNSFMSDIL